MKLCVIGCGYVGLVSAACFADLGHDVACYDTDAGRLHALRQGKSPIYEPGLESMLADNKERLHYCDDLDSALDGARIAFICVGTPTIEETGEANLDYVFAAAQQLSKQAKQPLLIVTKSTVPIGTNRNLLEKFGSESLRFASNPEFLREGSAIGDFMQPDRIVVGVEDESSKEVLAELYRPLLKRHTSPLVATGLESAEMIKYASNTFLAVRIAFINEIADICEEVGADIEDVSHGMGLDARIGTRYLQAGPGYGGSCFPKDTRALRAIARNTIVNAPITYAVVESNEKRRTKMVEKVLDAYGGSITDKKLAVLGLTFKPGTDDMRESPALYIIPALIAHGATIHAYDPEGIEEAERQMRHSKLHYQENRDDALCGADGVIVLTEWNEFKTLDLKQLADTLKQPVMIDMRNMFELEDAREAGLAYHSIGRGGV